MCGTDRSELLRLLPSSESTKAPTYVSRRRLFSTRIVAVAAFAAYVYSQIHVLSLRTPNGFKIYYPNEYFVLANFAASTMLNVYWLRQLFFKWDNAGDLIPIATSCQSDCSDGKKVSNDLLSSSTVGISSAQISYLPYHILGSALLTAWGIAWLKGYFIVSQVLAIANLCTQLYTVFLLLHDTENEPITPLNYLTHLVTKTNVGLAVLYMWKTWGIIDVASPSVAQMLNSGVIFLLMTIGSGPDPTVGLCLIYDLAALLTGQPENGAWYYTFHLTIVAICICLMIEMHLSQRDSCSYFWGFGSYSMRGYDYIDDDIERQGRTFGISIWIEAAVPPYFPYAT